MKIKQLIALVPRMLCHRMPERSFKINGKPFLVCARCTGIYYGFFFASLFFFAVYGFFNATLRLFFALLFFVPEAIDGGTQLLGWRKSNNLLRLVTGFFAGMGIAYLFYGSFSITFFADTIQYKLPTLLSLAPLLVVPFIYWAIKKFEKSKSDTLLKAFNWSIVTPFLLAGSAAALMWLWLIFQALIIYT